MARAYRLGKRAETTAATHQRIIDAARDLIAQTGLNDAPMGVIAGRAGVTRATIYQRFGSRHELLLAVLNDTLDRADVRAVRKALQHRDAAAAARGMLRASTRFWGLQYALFSRIKALAEIDAEFSRVDEMKESVRRGHCEHLVRRLAEQGCLRPGVSEREAFNILYLLSSFETFDHYYRRCGVSMDRIGARLVGIADAAVLV